MTCPTIQQIRASDSLHAGKVHEAVIRELDTRMNELRSTLSHISAQVENLRRIVVERTEPTA